MQKRTILITIVLLILISSSSLCINGGKDPKTESGGPWHDLTNFNGFLDQNFPVTIKRDSGSGVIKDIEDPVGALYIVVGVQKPFTDSETAAIHHFVESGGNIIVAADDETVNDLALDFGVKYSTHSILDKGFDYNYTFIPVTAFTQYNSYSIIVHSPHGLEISTNEFQLIAESSDFPETINSVLDKNDNNIIDGDDQPGPVPIIVEVSVSGGGKAIFISDAGLFSDNLWKLVSIYEKPEYEGHIYQNQEFISELLFNYYTPEKSFIYDKSKQTSTWTNFHPYPT
jgi:hypothetical protein